MTQPKGLLRFSWTGPHCFAYLTWEDLLHLGVSCKWLWQQLWGPGGNLPHLPLLALATTNKIVSGSHRCAQSRHRQIMPNGKLNLSAVERADNTPDMFEGLFRATGVQLDYNNERRQWTLLTQKAVHCPDRRGKHLCYTIDRCMTLAVPVERWGQPGATAGLRSYRWLCSYAWGLKVLNTSGQHWIITIANQFATACQLATAAGCPLMLVKTIEAVWPSIAWLFNPVGGDGHYCSYGKSMDQLMVRTRELIQLAATALAWRYRSILTRALTRPRRLGH